MWVDLNTSAHTVAAEGRAATWNHSCWTQPSPPHRQSGSLARRGSFSQCTAFPWHHCLSIDQKHHVAVPGWRGCFPQFSQQWMKVWTFGSRRIRELGSNFCRQKGSSVSSCPPPKADVRAHPSVVNFGSVFSSGLYLPACRCLHRREDAIWDALPRWLSSSHFLTNL